MEKENLPNVSVYVLGVIIEYFEANPKATIDKKLFDDTCADVMNNMDRLETNDKPIKEVINYIG